MSQQRKRRAREHNLTYRRDRRAWASIAEAATACQAEPLDAQLRKTALAAITARFGAEVCEEYTADPNRFTQQLDGLTDDQLGRAIRYAVGEARRRVRDGQDEDGLLAGVLDLIAKQPPVRA